MTDFTQRGFTQCDFTERDFTERDFTERDFTQRDFTPWPDQLAAYYRAAGYWQGETFTGWLAGLTQRYADRVAVVDGRRRWTYAQLAADADRVATSLGRLGIRRGDRVLVQLPNIGEFFPAILGLFQLGALPVFALPSHRRSEIAHLAATTEAVGYLIPGIHDRFDYRELAREIQRQVPSVRHVIEPDNLLPEPRTAPMSMAPVPTAPVPADPVPTAPVPADPVRTEPVPADPVRTEPVPTDPASADSRPAVDHTGGSSAPLAVPPRDFAAASQVAFLQLSGGSTGLPKLIPRTHDDYLYSVRASAEICRLSPETVYLCALPVAHNFTLSSPGVLGVLHAGGRVVMCPDPSPDTAFALIAAERVTMTALVPPLAMIWLDAAARFSTLDLSSLELLQVGGARLTDEAAARVRPMLGCSLQQVFGMAEGLVNYTRHDDEHKLIVGTQGRPISPDDEIRIVDNEDRDLPPGQTGHLLTRGPYTIRGYYRADEHNTVAFTADGFYRTGDLVRRTPTGHLIVEGRAKDQINRGGEKVAAEEVENHLLAHPGVLDAAVVAVPDPILGERTCAYVIPRGEAPTGAAIRAFVRGRGLAAYKIPDRVEFVTEFPRTAVGKVDKSTLRVASVRSHTRGDSA